MVLLIITIVVITCYVTRRNSLQRMGIDNKSSLVWLRSLASDSTANRKISLNPVKSIASETL